jgi:hypothetical protein
MMRDNAILRAVPYVGTSALPDSFVLTCVSTAQTHPIRRREPCGRERGSSVSVAVSLVALRGALRVSGWHEPVSQRGLTMMFRSSTFTERNPCRFVRPQFLLTEVRFRYVGEHVCQL